MSIFKLLGRSGGAKRKGLLLLVLMVFLSLLNAAPAAASEADLLLPDLGSVSFHGIAGSTLLLYGLFVCVLGMVFGMIMYTHLKNLPVHRSMREISELIFETCKTYLATQGKFILLLEVFIGIVMIFYFGWLRAFPAMKVVVILLFSLVGIAGILAVAAHVGRVRLIDNTILAPASSAAANGRH